MVTHPKSSVPGNEIVIENYYVTAFDIKGNYILVAGILTKDIIATDNELEQMFRLYYAINFNTDELIGPFDYEGDLKGKLGELGLSIDIKWIETASIKEDGIWKTQDRLTKTG